MDREKTSAEVHELRRISDLITLTETEIGIKGIIFDYGGTLDSRGDHWSHIILDAYRESRIDITTDDFKKAYVYAERALEAHGIISPDDNFLRVMEKKISLQFEYLRDNMTPWIILAEAGMEQKSASIACYCYEYARTCVNETKTTLETLYERYPLVMVSNFYGNLPAVLSDFGIDNFFSSVIESARVGIRKPDPAIFRLAIEALSLKGNETLVVGDSMKNDIRPALSLGCRVAHLPGREWPPE